MTSPADVQNQKLWVLGAAVIGGLFLGKEAVSHLFGTGLDEQERKGLLAAGVIGLFGGAMYLLDINEKWWNVEEMAKWGGEQVGIK